MWAKPAKKIAIVCFVAMACVFAITRIVMDYYLIYLLKINL